MSKMPSWINDMGARQLIAQAVKYAENNPRNHGVLSVKTANPSATVQESVDNNLMRWANGDYPAPWVKEKPKKFVDFMQKRWAPIGAENDPNNLNQNWAPNVRYYLKQKLGPELYKQWQDMNLVYDRTTLQDQRYV